MKVIVTGSLGNIGRPLTQSLVHHGHSVTVISSDPARKQEIEALGAKAAIGTMEDVDFLVSVFTGADVLHTMLPPKMGGADPITRSIELGQKLVKAIADSGVRRVVYISSYGGEREKGTGLIIAHHHIENGLSKISHLESLTLVRATYIYYNLYAFTGMIRSTGVIAANYGGEDRVVFVSPKDIAAAALKAIESRDTGRKVVYAASDERTCNEVAALVGKAIGQPDLKWVIISDAEMQSAYESYGLAPHVAAALVEMFAACHTGLLNEDYDRHKPQLGEEKLEDFVKEFAAAYATSSALPAK
jgi:uncharacterized protein YbjT (DUF2867 family)